MAATTAAILVALLICGHAHAGKPRLVTPAWAKKLQRALNHESITSRHGPLELEVWDISTTKLYSGARFHTQEVYRVYAWDPKRNLVAHALFGGVSGGRTERFRMGQRVKRGGARIKPTRLCIRLLRAHPDKQLKGLARGRVPPCLKQAARALLAVNRARQRDLAKLARGRDEVLAVRALARLRDPAALDQLAMGSVRGGMALARRLSLHPAVARHHGKLTLSVSVPRYSVKPGQDIKRDLDVKLTNAAGEPAFTFRYVAGKGTTVVIGAAGKPLRGARLGWAARFALLRPLYDAAAMAQVKDPWLLFTLARHGEPRAWQLLARVSDRALLDRLAREAECRVVGRLAGVKLVTLHPLVVARHGPLKFAFSFAQTRPPETYPGEARRYQGSVWLTVTDAAGKQVSKHHVGITRRGSGQITCRGELNYASAGVCTDLVKGMTLMQFSRVKKEARACPLTWPR